MTIGRVEVFKTDFIQTLFDFLITNRVEPLNVFQISLSDCCAFEVDHMFYGIYLCGMCT